MVRAIRENDAMPFTFLAHQAPVLPLKILRPTWFCGTALVVGSMAPDIEYFIRGEPLSSVSHTVVGQLLFCLPATVLLTWLVQRVIARPLALQLPDLGPLHLHDYGTIDDMTEGRVTWLSKVAPSALVGSFSHVAWDGFTHDYGWAVGLLPRLKEPLLTLGEISLPAYKVLQHGSTIVGALVTLALMLVIGRRRLLRSWRGRAGEHSDPSPALPPVVFWSPCFVGALVGPALVMLTHPSETPLATCVRIFLRTTSLLFVGLCVASLVAGSKTRAPATGSLLR